LTTACRSFRAMLLRASLPLERRRNLERVAWLEE
jgi:hypothetical protein